MKVIENDLDVVDGLMGLATAAMIYDVRVSANQTDDEKSVSYVPNASCCHRSHALYAFDDHLASETETAGVRDRVPFRDDCKAFWASTKMKQFPMD